MEKKYYIFILVAILATALSTSFVVNSYEPRVVKEYVMVEKVVESDWCRGANVSVVTTTTYPTPTPAPLPIATPKKFGKWGGISASESNPPMGTVYNVEESYKTGETVATKGDLWFVYHVGFWFNKTEWNAIPKYNKDAGVSVYDSAN